MREPDPERLQLSEAFVARAGWAAARRGFLAGDASNRSYDRLVRPAVPGGSRDDRRHPAARPDPGGDRWALSAGSRFGSACGNVDSKVEM